MIRTITICLLFSQISCEDDKSFSLSEILKMDEIFQEAAQFVKKEATDQQGILFIGTAKAGKSTLMNYVIGNKLKAIRPSVNDDIKITQANKDDNGPGIGMQSTSFTTNPTKWKSTKIPNYTLWDCPGFNDNRALIQDVTNAMYIYQLIKSINGLKFTLVVNVQDFEDDNIRPFQTLLDHLSRLFGNNFKNVYNSISVIYTRVPFSINEEVFDNNYINMILREKVVSQINLKMDESSRSFVNFTTFNQDNAAFFKIPKREGILSSCVYDNIIPAITNTMKINNNILKDVKPSVSYESHRYLLNTHTNLEDQGPFLALEELLLEFTKKYEEDAATLKSSYKITEILRLTQELREIASNIEGKRSSNNYAFDCIQYLRSLSADLRNSIDSNQLIKKLKAISYIEIVLRVENKMSIPIKSIMETLSSEIERLIYTNDYFVGNYFGLK